MRVIRAVLAGVLAARAAAALPAGDAAEILALKNRGLAQLEEGRDVQARRSFERLARLVPGEPLPWADGAVAALRTGDLSGARALLARASALSPGSSALALIAAAIDEESGDIPAIRRDLERAAELDPRALEARWRWVLASEMGSPPPDRLARSRAYLSEILDASPENVPARLKLLLLEIEGGERREAEASASALSPLVAPGGAKVEKYFSEGRALLASGNAPEAGLKFRIAENLLRLTPAYQQSLSELYTNVKGMPIESFSREFERSLRPAAAPPIRVALAEAPAPPGMTPDALRDTVDLANDGRPALYRIPSPYRRALFFDEDNDGDLDVYLFDGPGPDRLLRNNLDGTFTDVTRGTGDPRTQLVRAVVTDFDRDGDLDVVGVERGGALVWRSNLRQGRFQNAPLGIHDAVDVAAADLNADGFPDLVVATRDGLRYLASRGGGTFETLPGGDLARLPAGFSPRCVAVADLDNDGFPDVVVGGSGGILVFRNAGLETFTLWPIAPKGLGNVTRIVPVDADHDGDIDLLVEAGGRTALLRNEGGNANNWIDVELQGLATGSGKVNREGVGSLVEVKAGNLYGDQIAGVLPLHFGIGRRPGADVVRCVWTNGVPQNLFDQKARARIREVQELKGSCPFVYARDGANGKWSFVSDALGRSPIGLLYDGVHEAGWDSREWLKIPAEMLVPSPGGELTIDYTEELWEAAYLDMVRLMAVDHPEGTDFVPNERMVPGVLEKKIFTIARPRPVRAWEDGKDVTDLLAREDHRYVAPGAPTRYQGIRTPHDLVLDLGPISPGDRVMLYLTGWIFYTDTSINVSLSQRRDLRAQAPVLEVPDGRGGWKTAIADLGYPAGKTKTMPVDLTGLLDPADPRVRIETNLEIYWDRVYVTVNDPRVPVRLTPLEPKQADLFARGFSRRYRETPDGPELFDHDVVDTAPHWQDVPGLLTRYGDVTELLRRADDRIVVFQGGDAVRIRFDASALPALPAGWRRDWILVSDGWDKDFDKNTVAGTSIGPYPFHAMTSYPYPAGQKFPHPGLLRQWMTRPSSPRPFDDWVRDYGGAPLR